MGDVIVNIEKKKYCQIIMREIQKYVGHMKNITNLYCHIDSFRVDIYIILYILLEKRLHLKNYIGIQFFNRSSATPVFSPKHLSPLLEKFVCWGEEFKAMFRSGLR